MRRIGASMRILLLFLATIVVHSQAQVVFTPATSSTTYHGTVEVRVRLSVVPTGATTFTWNTATTKTSASPTTLVFTVDNFSDDQIVKLTATGAGFTDSIPYVIAGGASATGSYSFTQGAATLSTQNSVVLPIAGSNTVQFTVNGPPAASTLSLQLTSVNRAVFTVVTPTISVTGSSTVLSGQLKWAGPGTALLSYTSSSPDFNNAYSAARTIEVTSQVPSLAVQVPANTPFRGTAAMTVRLGAPPAGVVTVTGQVSTAQVVLLDSSVAFTASDWDVAKTMRVQVNGAQVTEVQGTLTGSNSGYNGVTATFTIPVATPAVLNVGHPTQIGLSDVRPYQFSLTGRPDYNVILSLGSTYTSTIVTISPTSLTFTPADWGNVKAMTVTYVSSGRQDVPMSITSPQNPLRIWDQSITFPVVAVPPTMTLSLQSTDVPIPLTFRGTTLATITLDFAPLSSVTLTPTASNSRVVSVTPSSANVTTQGEPLVFVVTGLSKGVTTVTFLASGGGYDGVSVSMQVSSTGPGINMVGNDGSIASALVGETASIQLELQGPPDYDVLLTLSSPNAHSTLQTTTVTVPATSWTQPVTVTAQITSVGGDVVLLTATEANNGAYDGYNSTFTFFGRPSSLTLTGPASVVTTPFPFALSSTLPANGTSAVTVTATSNSNNITITPTTLTTTDGTLPFNVLFSAGPSGPHVVTLTASGGGYLNTQGTFNVSTGQQAQVVLSTTSGFLVAGATTAVTVALSVLPSDTVSVSPLLSSASFASASPSSLTFTPDNYATPQTVSLNYGGSGSSGSVSFAASGGGYGTLATKLDLLGGQPSLSLGATSGTLYTDEVLWIPVTLNLPPPSDVVVTAVSSSSSIVVDSTRSSATFTASNFQVVQYIQVSSNGVALAAGTTATITLTASGSVYSGLTASYTVTSAILGTLCPLGCTAHGTCNGESCECFAGWHGPACDNPIAKPIVDIFGSELQPHPEVLNQGPLSRSLTPGRVDILRVTTAYSNKYARLKLIAPTLPPNHEFILATSYPKEPSQASATYVAHRMTPRLNAPTFNLTATGSNYRNIYVLRGIGSTGFGATPPGALPNAASTDVPGAIPPALFNNNTNVTGSITTIKLLQTVDAQTIARNVSDTLNVPSANIKRASNDGTVVIDFRVDEGVEGPFYVTVLYRPMYDVATGSLIASGNAVNYRAELLVDDLWGSMIDLSTMLLLGIGIPTVLVLLYMRVASDDYKGFAADDTESEDDQEANAAKDRRVALLARQRKRRVNATQKAIAQYRRRAVEKMERKKEALRNTIRRRKGLQAAQEAEKKGKKDQSGAALIAGGALAGLAVGGAAIVATGADDDIAAAAADAPMPEVDVGDIDLGAAGDAGITVVENLSVVGDKLVPNVAWWNKLVVYVEVFFRELQNLGIGAYIVVFFFSAAELIFDWVKMIFNLTLLHDALTKVQLNFPSIPTIAVPIDELKRALDSIGIFGFLSPVVQALSDMFQYIRDIPLSSWNCGGSIVLLAPFFVAFFIYVFRLLLRHDGLLRIPRFIERQKVGKGWIVVALIRTTAKISEAVLLFAVQVILVGFSTTITAMWSIEASCSAVDHIAIRAGQAFVVLLGVLFIFGNYHLITGQPIGDTWWQRTISLTFGGAKRFVQLTFGFVTNRVAKSFAIRQRAKRYRIEEDSDNQEQAVYEATAQSRTLAWIVFPYTLFLAQVGQYLNEPPAFNLTNKERASTVTPSGKRFGGFLRFYQGLPVRLLLFSINFVQICAIVIVVMSALQWAIWVLAMSAVPKFLFNLGDGLTTVAQVQELRQLDLEKQSMTMFGIDEDSPFNVDLEGYIAGDDGDEGGADLEQPHKFGQHSSQVVRMKRL